MKKIFFALFLCSTLFISARAQQKQPWKQMEDFHEIMSQTFHPAEEGHLEPIKNRSQEMVNKAVAWQTSTAPKGYDKKKVDASLKKLVKGAKDLNKLIKSKASDKVVKARLSGLHDTFHEIMEKCEKEDHHQ